MRRILASLVAVLGVVWVALAVSVVVTTPAKANDPATISTEFHTAGMFGFPQEQPYIWSPAGPGEEPQWLLATTALITDWQAVKAVSSTATLYDDDCDGIIDRIE